MSAFPYYMGVDGYCDALKEVGLLLDVSMKFPKRPFRINKGYVAVVEYTRSLGQDFGDVLKSLAERFDDEAVFLVATKPDPAHYVATFGAAPAFRINVGDLPQGYADGLMWEPPGEASGALAYIIDEFAIVGTSKKWAIWAQRDWEIAAVLTPNASGEWEGLGVPFFDRESDISSIRSPVGWGLPLSEAEIYEFWQNMSKSLGV